MQVSSRGFIETGRAAVAAHHEIGQQRHGRLVDHSETVHRVAACVVVPGFGSYYRQRHAGWFAGRIRASVRTADPTESDSARDQSQFLCAAGGAAFALVFFYESIANHDFQQSVGVSDFFKNVKWLIDWSIDRYISVLIDWLIACFFDWLIDWLNHQSINPSLNLSIDRLIDRLISWRGSAGRISHFLWFWVLVD